MLEGTRNCCREFRRFHWKSWLNPFFGGSTSFDFSSSYKCTPYDRRVFYSYPFTCTSAQYTILALFRTFKISMIHYTLYFLTPTCGFGNVGILHDKRVKKIYLPWSSPSFGELWNYTLPTLLSLSSSLKPRLYWGRGRWRERLFSFRVPGSMCMQYLSLKKIPSFCDQRFKYSAFKS